ncbi:MAG: nucleoside-diphosphate kinase [Thermoplasmatota archaeon]
MRERTCILVKPDGIQRGLVGRILERIESKGYKIAGLKLLEVSREMAELHYAEHVGKPFFQDLVVFITSGPIVAAAVEGDNVIEGMRSMMGKTDPRQSPPGTVRGDFGINLSRNVIHGSDSPESAKREIAIFFDETELLDYGRIDEKWLYPGATE